MLEDDTIFTPDKNYVVVPEEGEFEKQVLTLGSFLSGLKYPISKSKILDEAKKRNLSAEIQQFLKKISSRIYENAEDIMEEITGNADSIINKDTTEPSQ